MLTLIKLGGSLITDKQVEGSFREPVVARLAGELQAALEARRDLGVIVGHGSGSFGHFAANRYHTFEGVRTADEWLGFLDVAQAAAQLNLLVEGAFRRVGLPIWRVQPSASVVCHDGVVTEMAIETLRLALSHRLMPLIHGDVAFDTSRGGTIASTEALFFYLAQHLPVDRVLLLGEVEGVHATDGSVVTTITPSSFQMLGAALGGSAGVDVTGGMLTKVRDMLQLVQRCPNTTVRIMTGVQPGLLQQTLLNEAQPGTLIRAD